MRQSIRADTLGLRFVKLSSHLCTQLAVHEKPDLVLPPRIAMACYFFLLAFAERMGFLGYSEASWYDHQCASDAYFAGPALLSIPLGIFKLGVCHTCNEIF